MEHPDAPISKNGSSSSKYNWLPDFVYGGIDGSVTTFAVVAGVEGASLSTAIILILGFANLFADGFSMSIGKYQSDKAAKEQFEKIQQIEFRHLEEKPDHERQEVSDILALYGFKGKDLKRATDIITAHPEGWVDIMMRREFNMTKENLSPVKGALATFTAFVTVGFIPMLAYTFNPWLKLSSDNLFAATTALTLSALFIVGIIKSRFSMRHWLVSGLETLFVGGFAASIAYGVGVLLKNIAG